MSVKSVFNIGANRLARWSISPLNRTNRIIYRMHSVKTSCKCERQPVNHSSLFLAITPALVVAREATANAAVYTMVPKTMPVSHHNPKPVGSDSTLTTQNMKIRQSFNNDLMDGSRHYHYYYVYTNTTIWTGISYTRRYTLPVHVIFWLPFFIYGSKTRALL